VKINIWSIIFLIFIFHFTFTKKSLEKFFYFYCLDIIGIIIQIILFVTNIQKSIIPRETDEEIFKIIKEHLGIPWLQSKDYIILSFIFGIGVDKNQINTIYYEYLLIAIIYIYLDNFSYNLYNETDSNNFISLKII
jgi:bacteriorhodopsin